MLTNIYQDMGDMRVIIINRSSSINHSTFEKDIRNYYMFLYVNYYFQKFFFNVNVRTMSKGTMIRGAMNKGTMSKGTMNRGTMSKGSMSKGSCIYDALEVLKNLSIASALTSNSSLGCTTFF